MLQPKPLFLERMRKLLPDVKDFEKFLKFSSMPPVKSFRCNTLKVSPQNLKKKLEKKSWQIAQPYPDYPEIMVVKSQLEPGEIGKSIEHILGYYYVQEISSMMPIIALNPKPDEIVLDLCAAPGSKTTQACMFMKNKGTILANDKTMSRISILSANLQRCGCSNVLISRHDGVILCQKLKKAGMKFDKILLDLPCSGEGNTRSNPKTYIMWNINMVKKLSRLQRKLASSAIDLLKKGGELVYSTCTHAPEENEENIDFLIKIFPLEIEEIKLPSKCREGIVEWEGRRLSKDLKKTCRIYPQDNNTEGFFLCKMKKV